MKNKIIIFDSIKQVYSMKSETFITAFYKKIIELIIERKK